jgi:hypothetical protein
VELSNDDRSSLACGHQILCVSGGDHVIDPLVELSTAEVLGIWAVQVQIEVVLAVRDNLAH